MEEKASNSVSKEVVKTWTIKKVQVRQGRYLIVICGGEKELVEALELAQQEE